MVIILMILFFVIIGFASVAIWGLLPQRKTDNFIFRTVVWLSRPARGPELTRALFIAIPIIYALFFSALAGIPMCGAMALLVVFNDRYLSSLAK